MLALSRTAPFTGLALRSTQSVFGAQPYGLTSLRAPYGQLYSVFSFSQAFITSPSIGSAAGFATRTKTPEQKERAKARKEAAREKKAEKEAAAKEKRAAQRERERERRAAQKEKEKEQNRVRREREKNKKLKEKEKQEREEERAERALMKEELARIPKRAKSAYMFFLQDKRPDFVSQNRSLNILEVTRKLGEQWRALSDADKKVYKDKAEQDKVRSKKEREEYEKTLAPKRPLSSFMVYCNEIRNNVREENPKASLAEISKLMGKRWHALSESNKATYQQKAAELVQQYEKDMKKWEDQYVKK